MLGVCDDSSMQALKKVFSERESRVVGYGYKKLWGDCAPWYALIELPPEVVEVQEKRLRGDLTNLNLKRRGDKSMCEKQGAAEVVSVVVLQRLGAWLELNCPNPNSQRSNHTPIGNTIETDTIERHGL